MASRAATLAKAALSFDQERYDAERQRQLAERKLRALTAAHLQTLTEEATLELDSLRKGYCGVLKRDAEACGCCSSAHAGPRG